MNEVVSPVHSEQSDKTLPDVAYSAKGHKPDALTQDQIQRICTALADALQHEGKSPETLVHDLEYLASLYKGYKRGYDALNVEIGPLRKGQIVESDTGQKALSKMQMARIRTLVADALRHEGRTPGAVVEDIESLASFYKGYKNAYNILNVEVGHFRAYSAPYVRPDDAVANVKSKPSIFIVTLPKSATVYIANSIASSLGYTLTQTMVTPTFPKNIVWAAMANDFTRGGMVSVSHMQADIFNMRAVKQAGIRKGVLHIRDPRAALLSWVHFMGKKVAQHDTGVASILNPAGQGFLDQSFEKQVDSCIEIFYTHCINWITDWMDQLKADPRMDFLVVSHDELVSDERAYFDRILKFYDLSGDISAVKRDESTHFRKGDNSEWREVLTPAQIQRMNDAIPDWMWERFGWEK